MSNPPAGNRWTIASGLFSATTPAGTLRKLARADMGQARTFLKRAGQLYKLVKKVSSR